ncbi:MAG: hypothetical protein WD512_07520 [Candidatus Paceibacterota bacterium]
MKRNSRKINNPVYHVGIIIFFLFVFVPDTSIYAQKSNVNYDEKAVPSYKLPDPLILNNGSVVSDAQTWWNVRRPEILQMFENEMFGKTPGTKLPASFELTSLDKKALGGKATRKEITIYFTADRKGPCMALLIYLPNQVKEQAPVFLAMNFDGIHTIQPDTGISITKNWLDINAESGIQNNKAESISRGTAVSRWPVEKIIQMGFGLATFYYEDIDPDFDDDEDGLPF